MWVGTEPLPSMAHVATNQHRERQYATSAIECEYIEPDDSLSLTWPPAKSKAELFLYRVQLQDMIQAGFANEIFRGLGWLLLGLIAILFVIFALPHDTPFSKIPDDYETQLQQQMSKLLSDTLIIEQYQLKLSNIRQNTVKKTMFDDLANFIHEEWNRIGLIDVHYDRFEALLPFAVAKFSYNRNPNWENNGAENMSLTMDSEEIIVSSESVEATPDIGLPGLRDHSNGEFDTDSYIVLGASYGQDDMSLAVLLALSHQLQTTINQSDWRPHRTLLFCAWADPHLSPQAWLRKNKRLLGHRAVLYMDIANLTNAQQLRVFATVDTHSLILNASKQVWHPGEPIDLTGDSTQQTDGYDLQYNYHWLSIVSVRAPGAYPFLTELAVPTISIRGTSTTLNKNKDERAPEPENAVLVRATVLSGEVLRMVLDLNPVPVSLPDMLMEIGRDLRITSRSKQNYQRKSYIVSQFNELITQVDNCASHVLKVHQGLFVQSDTPKDSLLHFWTSANAFNRRLRLAQQCFLNTPNSAQHLLYSASAAVKHHVLLPELYNAFDQYIRRSSSQHTYDRLIQQLYMLRQAVQCVNQSFQSFI